MKVEDTVLNKLDSDKDVGTNQSKSITLNRNGRSAFTPYKPSTILTNLQRGNVKAQTPAHFQRTIFESAAQGELYHFNIDLRDVDEQDENGFTPLLWAASYGQLNAIKMLVDLKANVNHNGKKGESALSFAAAAGHVHLVKFLISRGANINHADHSGNTALMFATHNNHPLCVQELLKAGCDISTQNYSGDTVFSLAISRSSKQAQSILENHVIGHLFGST